MIFQSFVDVFDVFSIFTEDLGSLFFLIINDGEGELLMLSDGSCALLLSFWLLL